MYTIPVGGTCVGMTSGVEVEVVVHPFSLSALICGGPLVSRAAVKEEDEGLNCCAAANISCKWIGCCGACWSTIGFSSAFINLVSSVL